MEQTTPYPLPLLPLLNQVLLPAAFARLQIPSSWQSSVSLLEHLLTRQGRDVLVAVVPVLDGSASTVSRRASQAAATPSEELFELDKLHARGTAARVLQLSRNAQTGDWSIALEGCYRVDVGDCSVAYPHSYYTVDVEPAEALEPGVAGKVLEAKLDMAGEALAKELQEASTRLLATVQATTGSPAAARLAEVLGSVGPGRAADLLASILVVEPAERLAVLDAVDVTRRMRLVLGSVHKAHKTMVRAASARDDSSIVLSGKNPSSALRDAARMKALQAAQRSLGGTRPARDAAGMDDDEEEEEEEVSVLLRRIKDARPPPEVLKVALRESKRLQRSNEQHPGYAMSRTYLETLADLPWNSFATRRRSQPAGTADQAGGEGGSSSASSALVARLDPRSAGEASSSGRDDTQGAQHPELSLTAARAVLDEQHHGLDKVKERIVQYLAVRRLRGWDTRAPILCFIGPPGVGKTSLARSVAKVLGRPFHRIALGGVRDEAEVRGHRRTYIGAMPGRILQGLRRCSVRDPVMLLDEVDKLGRDSSRGDPASALLEVLDPEQNAGFVDTYLGVPFDLSKVVFLATGNRLSDIPAPLLDRLEVITLSGYTLDEKIHIAQKHLLPQLLEEHGLAGEQLHFPLLTLRLIVEGYTREAGVRALSRSLAAICRHVAVHLVMVAEQEGRSSNAQATPPPAMHLGDAGSQDDAFPPDMASASGSGGHGSAWSWREALTGSLFGWRSPATWGTTSGPSSRHDPSHHPPQHGQHALHMPDHPEHAADAELGRQMLGKARRAGPPRPDHAHHDLLSILPSLRHSMDSSASLTRQVTRPMHTSSHRPAIRRQHAQRGLQVQEQGEQGYNQPQDSPDGRPAFWVTIGDRIVVHEELIEEVLGPRKYSDADVAERIVTPGVAAGLVWTAAGGAVQYVECCCVGLGHPDKPGRLQLTGQVGEVLEESARIALSWMRAHAHQLGICDASTCSKDPPVTPISSPSCNPAACWDVHVHLPAGGVPKDGPSAGITVAVALASLFLGRCARADTAMTGELTLRGLVLPIGGLKEKLLAAHSAGVKRVLVPRRNMRDVKADLPAEIKQALEIIPMDSLEDVLREAFDPSISVAPLARL